MASEKITGIIETLKTLTVLELSELVHAVEDEFGVSAAAAAAAPVVEVPKEEEKTEFDVILKSFGSSKMNVIKAVRKITGLGLKESKELVESAPKAIKEAISKDDAEALKKELEEAGAEIEIK